MSSPSPTLGDFTEVDAGPDAALLVHALDNMAALPAIQRLRAAATELLAPATGDRLVDVGCGTGDVVLALAALVGPTGSVVGVEPSETMLVEARRRAEEHGLPVDLRRGDATRLD